MEVADYAGLDGVALAGLIRSGEITEREPMDAANRAMEMVEPALNAIVEWYQDPEPTQSGRPLSGVPFLRKDLGATEAGRSQEMGSRLANGFVPHHESVLMSRFKAAGLCILGRSATPEFGICGTTEPIARGPTRNPWAIDRSTGGSSGGAAAAVAAGLVPMAHASDGGGSIRIPAGACGLVGLKVSRGRVTEAPTSGESLLGLGVEFAVTRSVRDAATLLAAVGESAPGDPFVVRGRVGTDGGPTSASSPLRIAWTDGADWPGSPPVDREMAAAVRSTVAVLEDLGHVLVETTPQYDWEDYLHLTTDAFALGTAAEVAELSALMRRPPSPEFLEPLTLANVTHAGRLTGADVYGFEGRANRIRRQVGTLFTDHDLLVTPSTARPAVPLGTHWGRDPSLSAFEWTVRQESWIPFSAVFNITGQPAISLPLVVSSQGLPLGIQFVAGPGREDLLLGVARDLEEACPWADRVPPIHAGRRCGGRPPPAQPG